MDLRLDRLATLYLVRPLRNRTAARDRIPILMYHSIADEDEANLHPYYRTATAPDILAAQMKCLYDSGYSIIGLGEAVSRLQDGSEISDGFVITFDDGYSNFYRNAFPILNTYGFSATVFLPTSFIGETPRIFNGRECLTWLQVRELYDHGISFGSHTVTHPQLHTLDVRGIQEEVLTSKQTIEERIGSAVDSFAYPYAFPETDTLFKEQLRNILRGAGYKNGVCTKIGTVDRKSDALFLERLPVNSCDDASLFEAKLRGAYDWVRGPQYMAKLAKQWCGSVEATV